MAERSAVQIAEVVSDLRARRVRVLKSSSAIAELLLARMSGPVVDATTIYESVVANPKPVYLYEDHPAVMSPWETALVTYVNEHGNVIVLQTVSEELNNAHLLGSWTKDSSAEIDWSQVRWGITIVIWIGGQGSDGASFPVTGPMHMWRIAVYPKGEPADIRWVQLCPEYPADNWDMAQLVILGALNFMNCRNVDIVEPQRPRAEARRIARTGVQVSTINVFPVGRSTRSEPQDRGCGVPLSSVRGHFSHYGPDYDKGLLFGKYAGRFWIPQHARGDKALGEVKHDYVLKPGGG